VACGRAIRAGDMALVDDARLLGNAAKPPAAVADDGGSGHDAGASERPFWCCTRLRGIVLILKLFGFSGR
jgi:hypothetical protein